MHKSYLRCIYIFYVFDVFEKFVLNKMEEDSLTPFELNLSSMNGV